MDISRSDPPVWGEPVHENHLVQNHRYAPTTCLARLCIWYDALALPSYGGSDELTYRRWTEQTA